MTSTVATVRLADYDTTDALLESLEHVLDSRTARAVLFDATGHLPKVGLSSAQLAKLALFELPTVFAFEGSLCGSAADLTLAADIRVCSRSASLQGRLTGNARIRSLTNDAVALELFLGRTPMGAPQLLEAGLVTVVTGDGEAFTEGLRTAEVIASRGPIATRLGKEAVWRGLSLPLEQALRFETDLTLLLQTTKDRAEGVRAFLEKRPPNFTGE